MARSSIQKVRRARLIPRSLYVPLNCGESLSTLVVMWRAIGLSETRIAISSNSNANGIQTSGRRSHRRIDGLVPRFSIRNEYVHASLQRVGSNVRAATGRADPAALSVVADLVKGSPSNARNRSDGRPIGERVRGTHRGGAAKLHFAYHNGGRGTADEKQLSKLRDLPQLDVDDRLV